MKRCLLLRAMAAQKKEVNLLPKDEFERSFVGKFLKWSLSVGRYIVIGTELVVIGSFLARFSLDRQVTDLNEALARKQAVIASYGDLESEIRSIQRRLDLIGSLSKDQLQLQGFLDRAVAFTPVDVVYSTFSLSREGISLKGTAFSEAGFRTLVAELRENTDFNRVDLRQVSSAGDEGVGIDFDIDVGIAAPANQEQTNPDRRQAGGQGAGGTDGI